MEIKDWIYLVGLIVTFIISIFSLLINVKNRRNAIREHLFKEQMSCSIKLSEQLHVTLQYFYEVSRLKKLELSMDKKIETHLEDLFLFSGTNDFILPDDIISQLNIAIEEADNLHLKAIKGMISKDDIKVFQSSYFDLVEEMREEFGIDKLSDENKRLYQRNR
jgi:hypothetical protein